MVLSPLQFGLPTAGEGLASRLQYPESSIDFQTTYNGHNYFIGKFSIILKRNIWKASSLCLVIVLFYQIQNR
jgi:hypothetical protein